MKRNDIVLVGELISGDRFYKLKDKGKTVFEYGESKPGSQTVHIWSINNRNERQKPSIIKGSEQVVYLRNSLDKYAEDIRKITDRPPEQKD